jgi:hypothetical protein
MLVYILVGRYIRIVNELYKMHRNIVDVKIKTLYFQINVSLKMIIVLINVCFSS